MRLFHLKDILIKILNRCCYIIIIVNDILCYFCEKLDTKIEEI